MMPFGKKLEQLREEVLTYIKWKLDEKEDHKYTLSNNIKVVKSQKSYVIDNKNTLSYLGEHDTKDLCAIADAIQFYGIETYKDQIKDK